MTIEQFELPQAYILLSSRTGHPYIDLDGASHVFIRSADADTFAKDIPDVIVEGPKFYLLKGLFSQCYAAGADTVVIYSEDKEEKLPITEFLVEKEYYNHKGSRAIADILQYRKVSSLYELADSNFIVPVRIERSDNKVEILYAVAKKEDKFVYIAFTDLNEYICWRSRIQDEWEPVEVPYHTLRRISKHHGVLFNVCGNQFLLKREMMEKIQN